MFKLKNLFIIYLSLILSANSYSNENLSAKIFVEIKVDVSSDEQDNSFNESVARTVAKDEILRNHFKSQYKLPQIIKKNHKEFFLNLVFFHSYKKIKIKNFIEEGSKVFENHRLVKFSANVIEDNLSFEDPFELLKKSNINTLPNQSLYMLEFSMIYENQLNYDESLSLFLENYKNMNYVFNKVNFTNYDFIKYVNLKFNENELPNDLYELLAMYNQAMFNNDICKKLVKELIKNDIEQITKKIKQTCNLRKKIKLKILNFQNKKDYLNADVQREYLTLSEKFKLNDNFLFKAIIFFQGKLPIYFENEIEDVKKLQEFEFEKLLESFEETPSILKINLIKDKMSKYNFKNLKNVFFEQSLLSQKK